MSAQTTHPLLSGPGCRRCNDSGAVDESWCDCPTAARRQAELQRQIEAGQRAAEKFRAESLARCDRVIKAVPELSIDDVISRLRRVATVIGLDEEQLSAFRGSQVGDRQGRSRRARAAHDRWTALVDQRHSIMQAFDQLDDDIYRTIRDNEEMQARLFSLIAQGEA